MSIFNFCPSCASKHFGFPENRRFLCFDCGFTYYNNIATAVAIVLTFEDKILFTVRHVDPEKGKWDLPGGFVDPNETAETAACREIEEELGITIPASSLRYLTSCPNDYLYKNVPYRTLDMFYQCELSHDQISIAAPDEIELVFWVNRSEIILENIGFTSIRKVIGEFFM